MRFHGFKGDELIKLNRFLSLNPEVRTWVPNPGGSDTSLTIGHLGVITLTRRNVTLSNIIGSAFVYNTPEGKTYKM